MSKLETIIREFMQEHRITCAESIYQRDSVFEAAPDLVEALCNEVGYPVGDEDDD